VWLVACLPHHGLHTHGGPRKYEYVTLILSGWLSIHFFLAEFISPSLSLQPLDLERPPTPPFNELRYANSSYTSATWPDISSSADRAKLLEDVFNEENFPMADPEVDSPDEATFMGREVTRTVNTGDAELTWKCDHYYVCE
jgi:hypothetical protein